MRILDYMLEIHGKNETIWNVTFSTWGPNTVDYDLVAQHYRSPDNIYVTPIYNNSILALSTDGRKKPAQWFGQISTVAISVFDVFRPRQGSDSQFDHSRSNEYDTPHNSLNNAEDTMIVLPQPQYLKHMDIDPKLASNVFVQQTLGGHWYAMSGESYPSLVFSAPIAPWCNDFKNHHTTEFNHSEFLSSLIGVHPLHQDKNKMLENQRNPKKNQNFNNGLRAIDGPDANERDRHSQSYRKNSRGSFNRNNPNYPYDNANRVQRSPSEVYGPPPPIALPPPSPPAFKNPQNSAESEFGLYRSFVRIMENVFAFGIFFGFLAVAIRLGWFPQIAHLVEMLQSGNRLKTGPSDENEKTSINISTGPSEIDEGKQISDDFISPELKQKSSTMSLRGRDEGNKQEDAKEEKETHSGLDIENASDTKDIANTPALLPSEIVETNKIKKKVEIVEPEKNDEPGDNLEVSDAHSSPTTSPTSGETTSPIPAPTRRRKRGSRGGRGNKNKKNFSSATTEADENMIPEGVVVPATGSADAVNDVENGSLVVKSEPNFENILANGSRDTTVMDSSEFSKSGGREESTGTITSISDFNNSHNPNVKVIETATPLPNSTFVSSSIQPSSLTVSETVLGYGSHGTVVLKGEFESREVAVKRMLLEFYDVASHEVSLLQESDDHPNVIRYYCKQQSERFLYIALELCPGTLEDLIEKPQDNGLAQLADLVTSKQIMYQIGSGVQHLHSLKIVHRDLKPQNILVAPLKILPGKKNKNGPVRMLISDFGLCKRLEGEQSSFRTTTAQAAGTSGWRAPELLVDDPLDKLYTIRERKENSNEAPSSSATKNGSSSEPIVIDSLSNRRATRAIDIFSLGCVFYYILSNGQHPFGDKIMREANIVQNCYSLDYLDEKTQEDAVEARDLISQMISRNPRQRPDAQKILLHPFFWSTAKRLDFLLKVSDRFEGESRDPPSPLLIIFEEGAAQVVGTDWHPKLGQLFVENLGKYRKYHGDRILDLLRAMRNKSHHFNDMPPKLKEMMGPYPEGYLKYFTRRFPYLLMTIYNVVQEHLAEEDVFRPFFVMEE